MDKIAVWNVRNMDRETIKKLRLYAVEHNITTAAAITELVDKALKKSK